MRVGDWTIRLWWPLLVERADDEAWIVTFVWRRLRVKRRWSHLEILLMQCGPLDLRRIR